MVAEERMGAPVAELEGICENRAASHRYLLLNRYEGGLVLRGSEVKSLREGKVNLRDSYVQFRGGEPYLVGAHISPYPYAQEALDPKRARKLLLHKEEAERLQGQVGRKGYTLIPTRLYFKRGRAKVEFAVAQAKKLFDKRQDLKKRIHEREIARAVKARRAR